MNAYLKLLRTPGVARIMSAQLVARFPGGMISLGFLLHIESIFDSYGAAGLVLAATSVGQAVSGPLTSRWMGVWGMRPVLILTTSICAVALTTVALASLPLWGFMIVGLVVGLSYPPIQPAVRTIYPKMVNSRQLTPLFSLDASAQEIIWIAGPVVVTFVSTQISTVAGIFLSVFFIVVGGAWFIASPELGRVRIPRSKRRLGSVLAKPTVLLATVVGFLLVGACAATEAGVIAFFGDEGSEAGIVLAIWAVSSLIGGLSLGHVPIGPWALARRMLVVFIGSALAILAWEFWSLVVRPRGRGPLHRAGPGRDVLDRLGDRQVQRHRGGLRLGRHRSADRGRARLGRRRFPHRRHGRRDRCVLGALPRSRLSACSSPAVFHRASPDLRGRDASPLPDTEPVPVQPR